MSIASLYLTYGMGHKKVPVFLLIKTVFIRATEAEQLGQGEADRGKRNSWVQR